MGDGDILRLLPRVQLCHIGAQPLRAFNRAIGQLERQQLAENGVALAGDIEQLCDRQGFNAGLGEIVRALGLILVHPDFDAKRLDFHGRLFWSEGRDR